MREFQYYSVCSVEDLPEGERLFIKFGDEPIVIIHMGGEYYAIDDRCTHDDGPLGEGDVEGCEIICPRHGARFDLRNGAVLSLPAVKGVKAYPIRVVAGVLQIGVEL